MNYDRDRKLGPQTPLVQRFMRVPNHTYEQLVLGPSIRYGEPSDPQSFSLMKFTSTEQVGEHSHAQSPWRERESCHTVKTLSMDKTA
jgi:hypothetical protein